MLSSAYRPLEVSLATPNDRNINGDKIAEAIAASLTRAGAKVSVNAIPLNVYITEWRRGRYSFYMHGAGPPPATLLLIPQLAGTKDMAKTMGVSNESGCSKPALDKVLERALGGIDDAKRSALLFEAASIVHAETAVIPLHHEIVAWASRHGLAYAGRSDARNHVMDVRPR